jgi:hypothetical protein
MGWLENIKLGRKFLKTQNSLAYLLGVSVAQRKKAKKHLKHDPMHVGQKS